MKINREVAKKMVEEAGLIFAADTTGPKLRYMGVLVKFNIQGGTSTYGNVNADLDGMIDFDDLRSIIDDAKADTFVQRHHFGKE